MRDIFYRLAARAMAQQTVVQPLRSGFIAARAKLLTPDVASDENSAEPNDSMASLDGRRLGESRGLAGPQKHAAPPENESVERPSRSLSLDEQEHAHASDTKASDDRSVALLPPRRSERQKAQPGHMAPADSQRATRQRDETGNAAASLRLPADTGTPGQVAKSESIPPAAGRGGAGSTAAPVPQHEPAGSPPLRVREKMTHESRAERSRGARAKVIPATNRGKDPVLPPRKRSSETPPVIHVRIGRIEIRALPPQQPAAPRQRRVTPARPAVSLEEYLRRRDGGPS